MSGIAMNLKYRTERAVIILVSMIILSSFFVSCAGIKPPGYHNGSYIPKKIKKTESIEEANNQTVKNIEPEVYDNANIAKIKEFEEKIINSQIEEKPELKSEVNIVIQPDEVVAGKPIVFEEEAIPEVSNGIDFSEKLTTLDEQLAEVNSRQDATDIEINKMQNKISNLEQKISNIESQMDDYQKVKSVKSVKPDKSEAGNSFIIQPDEKANTAKTVKISYTNSEPEITDSQDKNKFEAGIKYFNAGKYSLAIQTLQNIENTSNTQIANPVNYYIAKSYYNTGDYTSALNYLSKITNNTDKNYKPEAHFLIAECYIKSGKADKAREVYREFVSSYPANKFTPQARKMLQKL
jgi:TolA-binding protein